MLKQIEGYEHLLPKRLQNKITAASYCRQGNFTIALVTTQGKLGIGVSKRWVKDKENLEIGLRIALARAIRNSDYPIDTRKKV